tara:strand:+ start:857 stop:1396 length:540 start_codon:yes stop_codon:yes gene_type:complete
MKKKIIIGVSGGIACYKTADLVSKLVQNNFDVNVCMTPSSEKFITALTFNALTGNETYTQNTLLDSQNTYYPHLYPATSADIFILIPATANIIGKIANGLVDDPVSSTSLSLNKECKKFFCPAMNNEMWDQKIVQNNCSKLNDLGWIQIGPDNGNLACGNIGKGRLSEIEEILKIILSL